MVITIRPDGSGSGSAATLANSADPAIGAHSDLKMRQSAKFQASHPVKAQVRKLYPRGGAGGTLTFRVRPRFDSLERAAQAVVELSGRRGLAGTLELSPGGTFGNAFVTEAVAEQIGVTVQVEYEIEFGA